MRPYTDLVGFGGLFGEESYVLGIVAEPGTLNILLDAVLTPDHRDYRPPIPGEQYCFRRARLRFEGVHRLVWTNQGAPAAVDASGEKDYGNIDRFEWDEAGYDLEGSWGRIEVIADEVHFVVEAE